MHYATQHYIEREPTADEKFTEYLKNMGEEDEGGSVSSGNYPTFEDMDYGTGGISLGPKQ